MKGNDQALTFAPIPRLNTYRALAALAVIEAHYFEHLARPPISTINFATAGVSFFFVLSGFLITSGLLEDRAASARHCLARFYVRRSFRIFPLYFFMLGIGLLTGLGGFRQSMPWIALYMSNYLRVFSPESAAPYAGHFWTLGVEEQFYLIWPLLVVVVVRKPHWVFVVALGLLLKGKAMEAWIYGSTGLPINGMSPLSYTATLSTGAMLAAARVMIPIKYIELVLRCLLPITVLGTWVWIGGVRPFVFDHFFPRTVEWIYPAGRYLIFAWLIARAVRDGPQGNSWGGRWLPALGTISYGIYVYHLPMRYIADRIDPSWTLWWPRFLAVGLTILAAGLSWKYIEKPALSFGRRLAGRIGLADSVADVLSGNPTKKGCFSPR